MKHRFGWKVGDVLLMSAVLLLCVGLFLLPLIADRADTAEIVLAEADEIRTVSLGKDADYEIVSGGVSLTVRVQDGEIFVSSSDCRDGICRNTPPISRAGQTIVCVPAGVIVRVSGEGGAVDGVSG